MTDLEVETHVEQVCMQGCNHVYEIIDLLEQGARPQELRTLPIQYHAKLLRELRIIMSVYEARDHA
jgi:hypothetical protein